MNHDYLLGLPSSFFFFLEHLTTSRLLLQKFPRVWILLTSFHAKPLKQMLFVVYVNSAQNFRMPKTQFDFFLRGFILILAPHAVAVLQGCLCPFSLASKVPEDKVKLKNLVLRSLCPEAWAQPPRSHLSATAKSLCPEAWAQPSRSHLSATMSKQGTSGWKV